MDEQSDKNCLLLVSKGLKNSEERATADKLYKAISYFTKIRGITAIHCDQVASPGKLNDRLIKHIIEDGIVIADLYGNHPHVFYGLALRHSTCKPAIHIIRPRQKLPFNYSATSPLVFDLKNNKSYIDFRRGLEGQLDAAIKHPRLFESPATTPMRLLALKKLGIPQAVELSNFLYENPDMEKEYKAIKAMLETVAAVSPERDRIQKSIDIDKDKAKSILEETLMLINEERTALRDKIKQFMESEIFPLIIKMELSFGDDREFLRKLLISKLKWFYMPLNYIDLSPYELHICELIAAGFNSKEIAGKNSLNYYNVLIKTERIKQKFNVSTRSELKKRLQKIL